LAAPSRRSETAGGSTKDKVSDVSGAGDLPALGPERTTPLVVWWWNQTEDRDVPPTRAIRWVELVNSEERRAGVVHASQRTADPRNLDDPAVRVELHHDLERRLGTTIRVDHALRHLGQLRVDRRLAVRGHRLTTVPLEGYQQGLLGGVAVRLTGGGQPVREVVLRAGLDANARDQLLVWAERTLSNVDSATGPLDLENRQWTATKSGGWQQLLYATPDPHPSP
jgi:hypothetical protein